MRRVLSKLWIVGLIAVAVGLGATYLVYDKATRLDQSTPSVVVEQYVDAVFNTDNDTRAAQLVCGDADLGELDAMVADISTRESQFGVDMSVTTANKTEKVADDTATVELDLVVSSSVSRSARRWQFRLEDQGGWRICEARRIG